MRLSRRYATKTGALALFGAAVSEAASSSGIRPIIWSVKSSQLTPTGRRA
jgi:hypothetical protein